MNGAAVESALAGDTADVALNGIDTAAVSAGSMLCLPQWPVPLVTCFEARVVVLDVAMPILKGRQVTCSDIPLPLTEAHPLSGMIHSRSFTWLWLIKSVQ